MSPETTEKKSQTTASPEPRHRAEARQVKAKVRMENIATYPDGSPKEEGSWVVPEGAYVPVDHPAVTMHPTHFEGV